MANRKAKNPSTVDPESELVLPVDVDPVPLDEPLLPL